MRKDEHREEISGHTRSDVFTKSVWELPIKSLEMLLVVVLKLSVPKGILSDTWLGILSEDPACNGESGREYINNKLE